MTANRLDLPQGTLDLLILKALSLESQHGWAVGQRIHQISRETLTVPQGSLYPALYRLEERGWVTAEWRLSERNRRAKFYALTALGRAELRGQMSRWAQFSGAVNRVLIAEERPS